VRVAVLSDIHGNLGALEAVVTDIRGRLPDLVLHDGDLALKGARPDAVVGRIRELGRPGVLGNADELLWNPLELERPARQRSRELNGSRPLCSTKAGPTTVSVVAACSGPPGDD
jgi:predicted phosphodiesterase